MTGVLHTKIARQELIKEWISSGLIHSQAEVVEQLKKAGFVVTQATASRDLEEIGALRGRDGKGQLRYQLTSENQEEPLYRVGKLLNELLVQIQSSGNILVLRTPPGGAQLLASALDRATRAGVLHQIIGTIAGDDTVMVIINDQYKSSQVLTFLTSLAEDVDTENFDESRKNSVENFEKSKARGKAGR
jgi:transcriptional regulator of arginine metabolism